MTGRITGTFTTNPVIRTPLGVITAGAYGGFSAVAPGSWMEIYGTQLANVAAFQTWSDADFKGNYCADGIGWNFGDDRGRARVHLFSESGSDQCASAIRPGARTATGSGYDGGRVEYGYHH